MQGRGPTSLLSPEGYPYLDIPDEWLGQFCAYFPELRDSHAPANIRAMCDVAEDKWKPQTHRATSGALSSASNTLGGSTDRGRLFPSSGQPTGSYRQRGKQASRHEFNSVGRAAATADAQG